MLAWFGLVCVLPKYMSVLLTNRAVLGRLSGLISHVCTFSPSTSMASTWPLRLKVSV